MKYTIHAILFLEKDIVDVIHEYKELSFLAIAIANTDFIPLLRNRSENFTFFAPYIRDTIKYKDHRDAIMNDKEKTFEILSRHIVVGHGALTTDQIGNDTENMMTIDRNEDSYIVIEKHDNDIITVIDRKGFNEERTIVKRDIHVSNGVLHIIDGVL